MINIKRVICFFIKFRFDWHKRTRIKKNILFGKVFIHVQLIIAVRFITNHAEWFALMWCDKIKQTVIGKGRSNKNRFIFAEFFMYDAIGITVFFTVYAYISSTVRNGLVDFPGGTI